MFAIKSAVRMRVGLLVGMAMIAAPQLEAIVVNSSYTLAEAAALAADVAGYPAFGATGVVQIQEGASSYLGTGTLVAPDWVLTAAHNWDTAAVTALGFRIGGTTYAAQTGQWFQNPQWISNPNVSLTQGADIALFHLDRPVAGVTPASLYTGNLELGTGVVVLGAGLAGTSDTGPRPNATSTLYAIRNTIDRVITESPGNGGLLACDFDDGTATRNSLSGSAVYDTLGNSATTVPGGSISFLSSSTFVMTLEGTTASGDSGGPAFADFGNGLELVGVVSWGVNPTGSLYGSGLGDITYFTRVSASNDWIIATIPEPGVMPLVAVAGMILLFRFQRILRNAVR
jgi:V8-like Glu-specific endopeptidase